MCFTTSYPTSLLGLYPQYFKEYFRVDVAFMKEIMDFSVSVIPSSSQQTLEFYTVGKIHKKCLISFLLSRKKLPKLLFLHKRKSQIHKKFSKQKRNRQIEGELLTLLRSKENKVSRSFSYFDI